MVNINGQDVNARTLAMLAEVEQLSAVSNLFIVKGKRIDPGDSSAGTHDGYGVVDLRTKYFTVGQRNAVLLACREVGFAAWLRTVAQGFSGPHIHAVAMGDPGLSKPARNQVTAYRNGHNGLANNGPDDGPKGFTGVTWESYLKAHQPEDDMPYTEAQIKQMVQDELEEYNKRFWVAPTGTGTALREDVAQIKEAVLGK